MSPILGHGTFGYQLVALFGKLVGRGSLAGGSIFLCTSFESLKFCATSYLLSLLVVGGSSPQLPAPATTPTRSPASPLWTEISGMGPTNDLFLL